MPMNPAVLLEVLVVLAATALILSVALFSIKILHRHRIRARGVRRAHYIGALGEIVARNSVPVNEIVGWQDDPVFFEVLVEFLDIVTGEERCTLEQLVAKLDLRSKLANELERARLPSNRLRALSNLVELADSSLLGLFTLHLTDSVAEVRFQAARGLARIGDPDSAAAILDLMESEDSWVAARLGDVLVEFGLPAVPSLVRYMLLSDHDTRRDPNVLRQVVRSAGLIGDLGAEQALIVMLESPEALIRAGAASALSEAGTSGSVPALIRALNDSDWRVRARAADALGSFSDDRAVEPLGKALQDEQWWVRQDAAKALATHPAGERRLTQALSAGDPFARDAALSQLGFAAGESDTQTRQSIGAITANAHTSDDSLTVALDSGVMA
jgi:HEAT repeat protein